jgi:hypothetical protein
LTLAAVARRCAGFVNAAFLAAGLTAIAALCLDVALPLGGTTASFVSVPAASRAAATCNTHAVELLTPGFVETGIDTAIDVLSYSTRASVLSKKAMKPHGPAIGVAASFPGATHYRDFDMLIEFRRLLRASAYTVAVSSALAACGGGSSGNSGDDSMTGQAATSTAGSESATSIASTTDSALESAISPVKPADDATQAASTETALATQSSTGADSTTVSSLSVGPATSGLAGTTIPVDSTTVAVALTTSAPTTTTTSSTPALSVASRSGIGMNLGQWNTTSPEIGSIDLMKRSGAWLTQCSSTSSCSGFTGAARPYDTLEEAKLDVDAQGWIRSLPAATDTTVKFRFATTVLSSGTAPSGKYVVRYDGAGTITYSGVAKKVAAESTPGRDVVQLTNSASGGFFLTITATTPGNYLRNIRVYPPGGACANDYSTFAASASDCSSTKGAFVPFESFPASQQIYPPFLSDAKGFRTLRFMDWMHTNTTLISDWQKRSLPTDRTWTGDSGVPIEPMIDISNAAGADPWMNIPTHATDDYVHQFGRLVHQRLATNLHLNLEYSNEPWNYQFAQTKWMKDQGAAKWSAELAKGANPYTLGYNWYAERLVQVCNIVKQEFGADASRVRCIANAQAANTSVTSAILACTYAVADLGKPCGNLIDVVAVAPYFGYYIGSMAYRPTVQTWYADADGGLNKLFAELSGVEASGQALTAPLMSAFPNGARGMSKGWMTTTKAIADKYGLPMWAYEGGQHLVPPPGDTDAKFLALIIAANRDARMGTAYSQDIADWKAIGGQVFAYYSHVATPYKFGIWGVKETLADVGNPKWQAVVKNRDTTCWWSGC